MVYECSLSRDLALDALLMAVWRKKPDRRVIVHSDQGSQYGGDDFRRFCQSHNLEPSMSRRGNCWDNAVAESFFSSLKKERIRKRVYKTRDLARADIFDYTEVFYNRTRRHSHLAASVPRRLKASRREDRICPPDRQQSTGSTETRTCSSREQPSSRHNAHLAITLKTQGRLLRIIRRRPA